MPRLWALLEKRKSAREVIALLVPIVIAVAGGFWAVFTYVFLADKPAIWPTNAPRRRQVFPRPYRPALRLGAAEGSQHRPVLSFTPSSLMFVSLGASP
jgi:hypothetical protein